MTAVKDITELVPEVSQFYKKIGEPSEDHMIIYDSPSETLEPVYFWILDFMNKLFKKVEKPVDNFTSSPGSGHFAEIGARATRMQEEGMKVMGAINTVLKSIINIIYDLKDFEIRLEHYRALENKDKDKAEGGMLALKQIWMDSVDIKRGRGSINMLAQDLQFVTLRDAFMIAKSAADVEKLDLNERVKRILKPRVEEFLEWKKRSEAELKKRFNIEKAYLKSQVNSLQLYTSWAKPYLKIAEQLSANEKLAGRADIVNIFNTMILELALIGKNEIKIEDEILNKTLPENFKNLKPRRNYYSFVLVDLLFRGIPNKVGQHYSFGGRVEARFRGYALNDEEIDLLDEKIKDKGIDNALGFIKGATDDSLKEIKDDLDRYLKGEDEKEKEEKKKKEALDINPFSALFSFGGKKAKEEAEKKKKDDEKKKAEARMRRLKENGVEKDNYYEKLLRQRAEDIAKEQCFAVFDVYKKAHQMPSHHDPFNIVQG
ncbi:hypothetical protein COV15_00990 [Candidatus Woesearchaeota archaeon CG10_big_fil_rev_8_21_14_0_10_34_12]|nr:MAG: hypothetical protein COV15_00990 [Candidatus Woesearchaeota archaeon CG10_big_fil_rev_8_21_14_0_10_34_12]